MCAVKIAKWILTIGISLLGVTKTFAENQTVNLTVSYKTVNFTGKNVKAIAVNNQIPGPTLHFKQGDHVNINVYNHLDKGTIIHWHGIIVPWQMDGVEGVSQPAILPGSVFHYHFILHQSGTYWYHAHAGLQEQQGLYGAFIIDPLKPAHYHYNKDEIIVLSDWINTKPDQVFANLKKEGDYYSPRFPLQPSLIKFIHDYRRASPEEQKVLIADYKMMQQMRMSIYDLSDVAYDAFLLNGQPNAHPWTSLVKVGDTVRLRFIGASSSTNFRVKIVGTTIKVVHVEGNNVKPYTVNDFIITPGETYDVLVKIQKNQPYIIYAESADTIGAAYGALITSPKQIIPYKHVTPFPEPIPVTREMMINMAQSSSEHETMNMNANMQMNTNMTMNSPMKMDRQHEPDIMTTGTKYQNLTAVVMTNDPNKPITNVIRMELFGYMDNYIWMINGLPGYQAKPILFEPGKRYRIIFTNRSMMHHPMHIHGHWFILRNGHGSYDPLLHTIDVPPGATVVADIDADASGQWFFHCHHLYHMVAGMNRVFQYTTIINIEKGTAKPQDFTATTPYANRPIVRIDESTPLIPSLITDPMAHPPGLYKASFLDIGNDFARNIQEVNFKGLYGNDYNKLELYTDNAQMEQGTVGNADLDIFYWHLLSQFWAVKGGMNYFYRPAEHPYWQPGVGIEGLLPYFIDTNVRTYLYSGSVKFDIELSRDTQITNNFFIRTGIESIFATKTISGAAISSGMNEMQYTLRPFYRLMPGVNLFVQYQYTHDYGALSQFDKQNNQSPNESSLMLGTSLLF